MAGCLIGVDPDSPLLDKGIQWLIEISDECIISINLNNFVCNLSRGNPKTLTPGQWTTNMDQVRQLPMDQPMDYPYGPPLWTTPKKE